MRAGLVSISPVAGGWVFIPQPCVCIGSFKPGSKGVVRSESNNGVVGIWLALGPRLCVAREVFFCDVLRILLSEFDEGLNEPSLGIRERFCVISMFVIIMSAEIYWSKDFIT